MTLNIDGTEHTIAEIEVALRYAAADAPDSEVRAALLIAAAALHQVGLA